MYEVSSKHTAIASQQQKQLVLLYIVQTTAEVKAADVQSSNSKTVQGVKKPKKQRNLQMHKIYSVEFQSSCMCLAILTLL